MLLIDVELWILREIRLRRVNICLHEFAYMDIDVGVRYQLMGPLNVKWRMNYWFCGENVEHVCDTVLDISKKYARLP